VQSVLKNTISLILQYIIMYCFDKVFQQINIYDIAPLYLTSYVYMLRGFDTFYLLDSEFQTGSVK
jgi:hypothetical protein